MKTINVTFTVERTEIEGQFTGDIILKSAKNKEIYFKYLWKVPSKTHNLKDINVEFANKNEYFNLEGSTFLVLFNKLTNRQQKIFSLLIIIMPNIFNKIKIPKDRENYTTTQEVDDIIYRIIFKK
jgi:hypothetical protein